MTRSKELTNETQPYYLDPSVLDWEARGGGGVLSDDGWQHPYEVINHVERVLNQFPDQHGRADAITALKRAIDHRANWLNELYQFKTIPLAQNIEGLYDRLAHVGVIRPLMLGNIRRLRNEVEHRYAEPPSVQSCREFSEVVWYFLRSTDRLARVCREDFTIEKSLSSVYRIEAKTGPAQGWIMDTAGCVPAEWLSPDEHTNWLRVETESLVTRAVRNERAKDQPKFGSFLDFDPEEWDKRHGRVDGKPSDVFFSGRVVASGQADRLYYLFFTAS